MKSGGNGYITNEGDIMFMTGQTNLHAKVGHGKTHQHLCNWRVEAGPSAMCYFCGSKDLFQSVFCGV